MAITQGTLLSTLGKGKLHLHSGCGVAGLCLTAEWAVPPSWLARGSAGKCVGRGGASQPLEAQVGWVRMKVQMCLGLGF